LSSRSLVQSFPSRRWCLLLLLLLLLLPLLPLDMALDIKFLMLLWLLLLLLAACLLLLLPAVGLGYMKLARWPVGFNQRFLLTGDVLKGCQFPWP